MFAHRKQQPTSKNVRSSSDVLKTNVQTGHENGTVGNLSTGTTIATPFTVRINLLFGYSFQSSLIHDSCVFVIFCDLKYLISNVFDCIQMTDDDDQSKVLFK